MVGQMGTETPRKTRRELAADATREDLLDAGAQLAFEAFQAGRANPLRLLSPSEIAERASERAQVSRAMIYHMWPSEPGSQPTERLDPYLAALYERFSSRSEAEFANKLLSAMRYEFGGHQEQ